MSQFCHLHCHSQYSLLDGASDLEGMIIKAKNDGQPAVALTDHGNMFGAFKFVAAAKKHGVKPIIGCEFYMVKDRHRKSFSRSAGERDKRFHQLLLAKNETGYRNLSRLCSLGYVEGLYSAYPRIDKELLLQYHEGLIATSCCLASEIQQHLLNDRDKEAEQAVLWWKDLLKDDFYLELQRHKGLENIDGTGVSQEDINQKLIILSKKHNIKLIATNDSHYLEKRQAEMHEVLLCVNTGNLLSEEKRFKFPSDDFYFKTTEEMTLLYPDEPSAIINTLEIESKVDYIDLAHDVVLPAFPLPKGFKTQDEYLRHITFKGAEKRYGELNEVIRERLDFELGVIQRTGYPGYFLIVHDFTDEARKMGVTVGPGRGSAAGSAVAYCLWITNIDPIKYDLLFERFLNPDRISLPDIDIDFDDRGRSKIIDYVINKYGKDQVAQIITYSTLGAKSSIRDVGRVMGVPLGDVDRICKLYPADPSASLKKILHPDGIPKEWKSKMKAENYERAEKIRALAETGDLVGQALQTAAEIEGNIRNTGIHACGVVITPEDIKSLVPVTTAKDNELLVTQFDNSVAEDAGLLKMDFLGLRTLTIINDAVELVKQRHQIDLDIENLPLDDELTFQLFQKGRTNGVFQYESRGMQKSMMALAPTRFEDLIAMNALYRPGPMQYIDSFVKRKHGEEEIKYDLPVMEKFLGETYGITIYQEQVMLLSQELASFTKGQADALRKGMGKKKKAIIDELYTKFVEGCLANGHPKEIFDKIWSDWEKFAEYAFNKSHSTCYAFIGYQTAYLKAHYPSEFMAAVLSNEKHDITKVNFYLRECKLMDIKVLGPNINDSDINFTVNETGDVVVGLSGLKGVGEVAVTSLIKNRVAEGSFSNIFDLTKRLNLRVVNKKALEALASAGAFDVFELPRATYFAQSDKYDTFIEHVIKFGGDFQKLRQDAAVSLFGESELDDVIEPQPPQVPEWRDMYLWERERETVGIYVSGHPLDLYKVELGNYVNCELRKLDANAKEGRKLTVAGIVSKTFKGLNKKGNGYARFTLQDYNGSEEFGLYQEGYQRFHALIDDGQVIYVELTFRKRYNSDELMTTITKVELLSSVGKRKTKSITLKCHPKHITDGFMTKLKTVCETYPGDHKLKINLIDTENKIECTVVSKKFNVDADTKFVDSISKMGVAYKIN